MSRNHNSFVREHKALSAVVAAVIAVGAIEYTQNRDCADAVISNNTSRILQNCIPHPNFGNQPSTVEAVGIKSEDLKTTALIMGFGSMSIKMGGSGTFNYDGGNDWNNIPWVTDYKIFYNRDNKKTTNVVGIPCVTFGDDYVTALDPNVTPGPITQTKDGRPVSTVKINPTYSPDGNTLMSVKVDAGSLDLCDPHVAQTQENELLWSQRWWNFGSFGPSQRGTYGFIMADIVTRAALKDSCFEEKLDLDAVKKDIKKVVIGELATDKNGKIVPGRIAELEAVDAANNFSVDIQPPSVRKEQHQKELDAAIEKYHNMKSTFPVDGKTYNLDPVNLDTAILKSKECKVNSIDFKPTS